MKDSAIVKCNVDQNTYDATGKSNKMGIISPKREKNGDIVFPDHLEFLPNLTPEEMFHMGCFGGTYYRPIYSCVTGKSYKDVWKEFPKEWFPVDVDNYVASEQCNKEINYWKVTSGQSLRTWETNGWIEPIDPYGWVQWYCRFYSGRRCYDDERQIDRWNKTAGEHSGRWRKNLINKINRANATADDPDISPVIHQLLLQWAFKLTDDHLLTGK